MSRDRALRADARRNADAIIEAAQAVFTEKGVDVPMEEIARAAGVGKGTLYRHFPTKDHVFAAVSHERFSRLTSDGEALLAEANDPLEAFIKWLRDYDRSAQRYRGLRAVVSTGIADETSAIFVDCAPMKEVARQLLKRTQDTGQARRDIDITELLSLIAALPERFRDEAGSSRLLDVILWGLAVRQNGTQVHEGAHGGASGAK